MSGKIIRISDEVYKKLQDTAREHGYSFVSPDNLLRFLLGLPQAGKKQIKLCPGGGGMKQCPHCHCKMTIGAPHDDGDAYQWECHQCGYVEGVSRSTVME